MCRSKLMIVMMFVIPSYCHFNNGVTNVIDNVFHDYHGLTHVVTLAVHLDLELSLTFFLLRRSHGDKHRMIFCGKCNTFVKKKQWVKHKCNHRVFSCDHCSYSTGRSDHLAQHVRTMHSRNNNINNNNVSSRNVVAENNNSSPDSPASTAVNQQHNSTNNSKITAPAEADNSNNKPPAEANSNNSIPGANSSNNILPGANSSNNIAPDANSSNNIAPDANSSNNIAPDANNSNNIAPEANNSNNKSRNAAFKTKKKKKVSLPGAVKAGVSGMLTMALLTGCAGPVFVPPEILSTEENKVEQHDSSDENWEYLNDILPSGRRGRGRPPGRTPHVCPTCNFSARTHKRLLGHMRKHDRAAKLHFCKYNCGQSSFKPSDIEKHQTTCLSRPQVPNQLDADTIWEILSLCPLSNRLAFKLLKLLEKALGIKYLPKRFKKTLSDYLNSTFQYLESEIVQFKVRIIIDNVVRRETSNIILNEVLQDFYLYRIPMARTVNTRAH